MHPSMRRIPFVSPSPSIRTVLAPAPVQPSFLSKLELTVVDPQFIAIDMNAEKPDDLLDVIAKFEKFKSCAK